MNRQEITESLSRIVDVCEYAEREATVIFRRIDAKENGTDAWKQAKKELEIANRAVYDAWKMFRAFNTRGEIAPGP